MMAGEDHETVSLSIEHFSFLIEEHGRGRRACEMEGGGNLKFQKRSTFNSTFNGGAGD
ncbi:hypothetical protein SBV1_870006 [Verrucomicrobia bacterium]|nr:hypothetical protein SBV1_870006 [Verrucomicrobiota bacterium]